MDVWRDSAGAEAGLDRLGFNWFSMVGLGCKYLTGLGRVGLDCFQTGSGLDRVGASNISSLDF